MNLIFPNYDICCTFCKYQYITWIRLMKLRNYFPSGIEGSKAKVEQVIAGIEVRNLYAF